MTILTKIINKKKVEYRVRDYKCKRKKCFTPFSGNGQNICRLYELGKSPEQEIKDEIRVEYAKTYPNIIFTLANEIENLKARPSLSLERIEEVLLNHYCHHLPAGLCGCKLRARQAAKAIKAELDKQREV